LFLVGVLLKWIHFDSQSFCSRILSAIVQNRTPETPEDRRQRMVLHFDNATSHTSKCTIVDLRANRLTRVPHPAFSPDMAPSDFYRFGKLKMMLMGAFAHDELLQGVMKVFNGISREEIEVVFEEWLLKSERCIQQNGEYVESESLINMFSLSQRYPVWPC
jgi:histone-lysine N-methyltransferase SETMAR